MKLEDIKPAKSRFKLSTSDKEYFLRPLTLEDEIWVKNTLGEKIDEIFSGGDIDFDSFSRIVYHIIDDKRDFKKEKMINIDEEGEEVEVWIGGYKKFQRMILNMDDKIEILTSFNDVMAKSRPEVKATAKNAVSDKKKEK